MDSNRRTEEYLVHITVAGGDDHMLNSIVRRVITRDSYNSRESLTTNLFFAFENCKDRILRFLLGIVRRVRFGLAGRRSLELKTNSELNVREFGNDRGVDCVKVVRGFESPMCRQFIQKTRAEIAAKVRRAWTEPIAACAGIHERPNRTAARQVHLAVR